MTELEIAEKAEKTLNRRGYNWHSYGSGSVTHSLCLGGAIGIAVNGDLHTAEPRDIHHPVCARIVGMLPKPAEIWPHDPYDDDSVLAVSRSTRDITVEEVRAALSQVISECRAEEVLAAERELTTV